MSNDRTALSVEGGSHTKGPWRLQPSSNGGLILVRGDGRYMSDHPQSHLQIVPEADARLIAAAPELLAACKEVLRVLEDPRTTAAMPHTAKLLRAAIAKATAPSIDSAVAGALPKDREP